MCDPAHVDISGYPVISHLKNFFLQTVFVSSYDWRRDTLDTPNADSDRRHAHNKLARTFWASQNCHFAKKKIAITI